MSRSPIAIALFLLGVLALFIGESTSAQDAAAPVQVRGLLQTKEGAVKKAAEIKKDDAKDSKVKETGEVKKAPTKPSGPPEFEVHFADDSSVRANLMDSSIIVVTKYGKLTIPISELRRVEMGFRYPEGMEAKVDAAIADLGSTDFAKREAAEKALFEMKEYSVHAIKRATKSPDKEVVKRAEGLMRQIKDKLPAERLDQKDTDTIETSEFTFQGKIETQSLKAKTRYFAESSLKVAELRGLRMAGVENNDTIVVEANKYGLPNDNTWMETPIEIVAGRPFEASASGSVDQLPQQGGQYVTQPNGQPQYGTVQVMMPNGRRYQYSSGTLIGRVGPNGDPFVLGSNYKSPRMSQSGKLYVKIVASQWGVPTTGSYKIVVKSGG
ncbi:MAG: hypothetical protein U0798_13475 [Gemmataceae bacterium]